MKKPDKNGPQTDDELWQWIKDNLNIEVPKVAVCDDHQPPFQFLADIYFERVDSAIAIANRGGSKTMISAIIHLLNSIFRPGCESGQLASEEQQSRRAYGNLQQLLQAHGKVDHFTDHPMVERSVERETNFKNGSKVEIIIATPKGVNGPHPQKLGTDENELIPEDIFQESLAYGTPVFTPTGTVPIEFLEVGDSILGRDGEAHFVEHVYDHGIQKIYRVNLSDGRSIDASGDHRWMVCNDWQRKRGRFSEKTTDQLRKGKLRHGTSNSPYWFLPNPEPLKFEQVQLPADPYLMGVMLGDGNRNVFTSNDPEIAEEISSRLGSQLRSSPISGTTTVRYRVPRAKFRMDMEKSLNKRVPDIYFVASVQSRYDLLRGLMDTDGHASSSTNTFSSISRGLVEDVAALARSLGGRALLSQKSFISEWSKGTLYTATICCPEPVFGLQRKIDKMHNRQRTLMPSIVSIEEIAKGPVRCIGTSAPDETFVAGDYIVTKNSRNMSQSKNGIMAQDWITSTRKYAHGPMQKLLDENIEVKRAGADPPYAVYTWCVFEAAEQVPNCQIANPGCENPCPCDRVVKGAWDDGSPRKFSDICQGKLARSEGFMTLKDVHKRFRMTNQEMYEAQQLCSKPETQGLVFYLFTRERHGIKWWDPDPSLGPIYMSVDFGDTNPSAVSWYQVLNYDTPAYSVSQAKNEDPIKILKEGTRVCFDEIYVAQEGNIGLAKMVVAREKLWRERHPNFRVSMRFADVQNAAGRRDWATHETPLRTSFFATRDVKEQVKICRELFRENRIMVDVTRCEMFCEEAEYYHYPKKQSFREYDPELPVDDFNHVMSNFRYCMMHLHVLDIKERGRGRVDDRLPRADEKRHTTAKWGTSRYAPRADDPQFRHPIDNRDLL